MLKIMQIVPKPMQARSTCELSMSSKYIRLRQSSSAISIPAVLPIVLFVIGSWLIPIHRSEATERHVGVAWRSVAPGLQMKTLKRIDAHAFRIDLNALRLTAKESEHGMSVSDSAKDSDALVAVNGNFFDPQYRTQGLLRSDGKNLSQFKRADWGVFSIHKDKASIVHTRSWTPETEKSAEFAIQCGPRLVVNGRVLSLKPQWARRTAIGVEPNRRFVLLVVVNKQILTSELALMMKDIGARYAVNLDGGSSSQLWMPKPNSLNIRGARVANAILVVKR